MSIEALWTVRFGRPETPPGEMEGGVLVVESSRMFGGDSIYAYTGRLEVAGEDITGDLTVILHNPNYGQSIYGKRELQFTARFIAKRVDEKRIEGWIKREGEIDVRVMMRWLADLP